MVTFEDPVSDADAAREALRGLAHATRTVREPMDSYAVLGSLTAGLASLGQSLEQLADWHERSASLAADDAGDRATGAHAATQATAELRDAAASMRDARTCVDAAWNHNARIAWQPEPATTAPPERQLAKPSSFGATSSQRDGNGLGR